MQCYHVQNPQPLRLLFISFVHLAVGFPYVKIMQFYLSEAGISIKEKVSKSFSIIATTTIFVFWDGSRLIKEKLLVQSRILSWSYYAFCFTCRNLLIKLLCSWMWQIYQCSLKLRPLKFYDADIPSYICNEYFTFFCLNRTSISHSGPLSRPYRG